LKIKVCGLTELDNVQQVATSGIDYAGFIFYPPSKRNIDENKLPTLVEALPEDVKSTGVFVSEDLVQVILKARQYSLSVVQLHGDETPEDCERLRDLGFEVIKVFSVADTFDLKRLDEYDDFVDYFLFDTKGKLKGGNGVTFNWDILDDYAGKTPFFLSGGISIEKIEDLSVRSWPGLYAVDVNSQFETKPGVKDPGLIKRLVKEIKGE